MSNISNEWRVRVKTFGRTIWLLLLLFIPSFFAYLSGTESILDNWKEDGYLGPNFNVDRAKQFLLIVGVLITSGYLTISNELKTYKIRTVLNQRQAVLYENKTAMLLTLEGLLNEPHISSMMLRVYKKEKSLFKRTIDLIMRRRFQNEKLVLAHIDGLSNNDISRKLSFDVSPSYLQGLVGECYDECEIKYEEDFSRVIDTHSLSPFQRSQYLGVRFWLCSPIINHKGQVVSVLSFESIHPITIPSERESEVALYIGNYCTSLYLNFPELFK